MTVMMKTDHPPAQPASYKPEYAEQARKLCLLMGATDEELARFFDVSGATLGLWLASIPEFADAVAAGQAMADAEVADRLFRRAIGYSHTALKVCLPADSLYPAYASYVVHYPPVTSAAIFWLKNRRGDEWRDKVDAGTNHDHDPESLSDEELATIIARELGKDPSDPEGDPS